ncbi:MAG: YigZ family protein [Gammaproteobacteria bacterium]|nr:YigZ family protein [Gammaproteobacteria bacterium]
MPQFQIVEKVEHTLEVKKSQFITWVMPITSKQQAKEYIQQAKAQYPDARHHCWAYVMGDNPNSMTAAMSDDGEPSGTAGKPMLNVLQHKPVSNVMAIVIRYFGGVKLGAGGLVRAYSQAVEQGFSLAELSEIIPMVDMDVSVPFADEQWLRHQAEQFNASIEETNYSEHVDVFLTVPAHKADNFKQVMDSRQIICKIRA